jgi:hypothetical protein
VAVDCPLEGAAVDVEPESVTLEVLFGAERFATTAQLASIRMPVQRFWPTAGLVVVCPEFVPRCPAAVSVFF